MGGGFGLAVISYCEIADWARLTGTDPTPWEVSVLRRMSTAMVLSHDKDKKPVGDKSKPIIAHDVKPDDWQALDRMLDRLG